MTKSLNDIMGHCCRLAKSAYRKSEIRDFADGYEVQDWLEAEEEVGNQCSYWFQDIV